MKIIVELKNVKVEDSYITNCYNTVNGTGIQDYVNIMFFCTLPRQSVNYLVSEWDDAVVGSHPLFTSDNENLPKKLIVEEDDYIAGTISFPYEEINSFAEHNATSKNKNAIGERICNICQKIINDGNTQPYNRRIPKDISEEERGILQEYINRQVNSISFQYYSNEAGYRENWELYKYSLSYHKWYGGLISSSDGLVYSLKLWKDLLVNPSSAEAIKLQNVITEVVKERGKTLSTEVELSDEEYDEGFDEKVIKHKRRLYY